MLQQVWTFFVDQAVGLSSLRKLCSDKVRDCIGTGLGEEKNWDEKKEYKDNVSHEIHPKTRKL